MKKLYPLFAVIAIILGLFACASPGNPDGGMYDETPPRFVGSSPAIHAVNVKDRKISLEFDEYVKLEKAAEKVVISPPQTEAPEIKAVGRRVVVKLNDTLRQNTTYTIDFGDAIVDNNEGNPLGYFTYTFSTGESIDTMEVSGTLLNAEDLEPIKGHAVGLHENLNDTAFTHLPFLRIARTDSRGRFSIKGVKSGKYHIFALQDNNQNNFFDVKTERIAFLDSIIVPTAIPATRQDTVFNVKDSLLYDTIRTVEYTRYLPDDLVLRSFKEVANTQFLAQDDRPEIRKFILKFNTENKELPTLKGLNFDERDAFVVEANEKKDSLVYWIKDSLLYERDTLSVEVRYLGTDSLNAWVERTDTLQLTNKINRARRAVLAEEAYKKALKEHKKKYRSDSIPLDIRPKLAMKLSNTGTLELGANPTLTFDEPIAQIDTSLIRLSIKVDTLWQSAQWLLEKDSVEARTYQLLAEWEPGAEYRIEIDTLAFKGLYSGYNKPEKATLTVKKLEDYASLFLTIQGTTGKCLVQLLEGGDKVVRTQPLEDNGTCDFYFLRPNTKYYVRLIEDANDNGRWDTGNYAEHRQPEMVYYCGEVWEMKANFDAEYTWNVKDVPLDKQKLLELKKQKPEEERKVQKRNKERARRLGISEEEN